MAAELAAALVPSPRKDNRFLIMRDVMDFAFVMPVFRKLSGFVLYD